jgi:LemA protein
MSQATSPSVSRLSAGKGILLALVGIVIVAALFGVVSYNSLVALDEQRKGAWSQVETVLQRRFDLIPNLVNTVKGYAAHEKEVLEQVTKYRSQWGAAKTVDEKARAAGELEGVLSRLLVVAEQYPDLKANQNFRDLQVELAGTENRISVERSRYNDSVRAYNTRVRGFPGSIVAGLTGFETSNAYFESDAPAKEAPRVDFSGDKKE